MLSGPARPVLREPKFVFFTLIIALFLFLSSANLNYFADFRDFYCEDILFLGKNEFFLKDKVPLPLKNS
jgi:hypothetical protein